MATLLYVPHMAARVRANPWLFSIVLVNMLAMASNSSIVGLLIIYLHKAMFY